MKTNKPYLLRALNDWINDNECTPYLLVDATFEGVVVPKDYIKNGEIVLNLKPHAIRDLSISNTKLAFRATFTGVEWEIVVPLKAVKAIYAQENGEGMMFEGQIEGDDWEEPGSAKDKGRPHLSIVK